MGSEDLPSNSIHIPADTIEAADIAALKELASEAAQRIQEGIAPAVQVLVEQVTRSLKPAIDRLESLAPRVQEAVVSMARAGWYYDPEMGMVALAELRDLLAAGQTELADGALCDYFEQRLDDIEAGALERFPHRQEPIKAALRAHRIGEYFLSVPVLFAQIDGICVEVTSGSLFTKNRNELTPQTSDFVHSVTTDVFGKAFLSPFAATDLPVAASKRQRGQDWKQLNRHQVMHGESLDYGTRVNSLKTVSLLRFVVQVPQTLASANS